MRPKLDLLRDKAVAGDIEQILMLSPDRLARKYTHQLLLVEEFKKLGVTITFANRQIATSPEDQLLLQMQGVIAEYEREKILERHRRGKLHKAQQGKVSVLSGAPYGYVYIPATETEDAHYEILEREAVIVRRVFHLLVNEQQSIGAIARLAQSRLEVKCEDFTQRSLDTSALNGSSTLFVRLLSQPLDPLPASVCASAAQRHRAARAAICSAF
jgi:site-specific DNA recombinase